MKDLGIRVALGARKTQVIAAAVGRLMVLRVGSVVGLLAGVLTQNGPVRTRDTPRLQRL
jgi:hypothetical protein